MVMLKVEDDQHLDLRALSYRYFFPGPDFPGLGRGHQGQCGEGQAAQDASGGLVHSLFLSRCYSRCYRSA